MPDVKGFDALWVMEGPMDVWEEDKYPCLNREKKFTADAVSGIWLPFSWFVVWSSVGSRGLRWRSWKVSCT